MQFSQIIFKKAELRPYTYQAVKVLIFLFLAAYTVYTLNDKPYWSLHFLNDLREAVFSAPGKALLVVLLLPANWGLEALKWQTMVKRFHPLSYTEAYKGILTGVAMGFATPHGLGDYFGRILRLPYRERSSLVGAVFLTRMAQLAVTVIAGGLSLLYFIGAYTSFSFRWLFLPVIPALVILLAALLVSRNRPLLYNLVRQPWIQRFFGRLQEHSSGEFIRLALFSVLRYGVFTLQFVLLIQLYNIPGTLLVQLLGVNLIFLAKSVIPTLFDLGVREYAAWYFFAALGLENPHIVQASIVLWLVNVLSPSLIGMFLVFGIRFRPRHDQ